MTKPKDDSEHAKANGRRWMQHIREMLEAVGTAEESGNQEAKDEARERIQESPLSIQVRIGWYSPGTTNGSEKPEEYEILLSTGGPALHIVGELDERGEPETANLQWRDWFTPWNDCETSSEDDEALLAFATHFYLGE